MEAYIGAKIIAAEEMSKGDFNAGFKGIVHPEGEPDETGYHVQYSNPDGSVYDSWSPTYVFERAYRVVSDDELSIMLPGPSCDQPGPGINCRPEGCCETSSDE